MTDTRARMMAFVEDVFAAIGPRPACSEAEGKLGDRLWAAWASICDAVEVHEFTCRPRAFLGVVPAAAALYGLAVAFAIAAPPLGAVLGISAFLLVFLQVYQFREVADRLFPPAVGRNVMGIVRPSGPVRRRLLVCAHQDSAWEVIPWYLLGRFATAGTLGVAAAYALVALGTTVGAVAWMFGAGGAASRAAAAAGAVLFPLVGAFTLIHARTAVPGAIDDLSGLAVVDDVGRTLRERRGDATFFPRHTEVWLVATSAEEAGLRGARALAVDLRPRVMTTRTYAVFLDAIADLAHLKVVTREWGPRARHDERLVAMVCEEGWARGIPVQPAVIRFGGTDAAAFTRAGIPSVAIVGQAVDRLPPEYHTRLDTPDRVRPEALEATLAIVLGILRRLEEADGPAGS